MKVRLPRAALAVVSLCGVLAVGTSTPTAPASAIADDIESTYAAPGPWKVERSTVLDDAGRTYVVHQPADLGASGTRHPIVTWGNGTLIPALSYAGVLDHLASWGFVTIATTSTSTGTGDEILAAARYLVEQDAEPSSAYHGKLETSRVGAIGHSQGAIGALNAATKSDGLITTVVPVALPDLRWRSPEHEADLSGILQPVFFVAGSEDWVSTPSGLLAYVRAIPGSSTIGRRAGALHDAILDPAGAYLGYVTAWMRYRLSDDPVAAEAFEGPRAEILNNPLWLTRGTR